MINSPDSDMDDENVAEPELEDTTQYLREMVVVNVENPKRFYARTKEQQMSVDKLQKSMERIYDADLRNVDEVESLYPPLEVTPNNASNLSDFLVVKHRGTFKRATLEEPWQPGSESIQVRLLDEGLCMTHPIIRCFKPLKHFFLEKAHVKCFHLHDVGPGNSETESQAKQLFENNCPKHKFVDFLVRGPEERMSDGQSSLPVEVLLSEKIVECHLSVARPVTKYLSPLLIQAGLVNYPLEVSDFEDEQGPLHSPGTNPDLEIDTLDGLEPVKKWPNPVIPPGWLVDTDLSFCPVLVDDVGQIYVQPTNVRDLINEMESLFSTIFGGFDENFCSAKTMKEDWKEGEDCVVFSKVTHSWNRGRVVKAAYGNFMVFFVDYGCVVGNITKPELTYQNLRIPYHFGDVPMLHVRLVLEGIVLHRDQYNQCNELVLQDLCKLISPESSENKVLIAQRTRDVKKFPIPVILRIEKINPESESNRLKTINVGESLLRLHPNFLSSGSPNLTKLEAVHLDHALGIESQEPEYHDSNIPSSELENPYPPPELPPDYDSGYLLPVKIGFVGAEFFCIHFSHQDLEKFSTELLIAEAAPPSNLDLGDQVVCLIDKWYRGYILDVTSQGRSRKASVFLVDRGDVKFDLDPICFRQLPESLCMVPMLTFRCYANNFTAGEIQKLREAQLNDNYTFLFHFHGQPNLDSVEGDLWVQIEDAKTGETKLIQFENLDLDEDENLADYTE